MRGRIPVRRTSAVRVVLAGLAVALLALVPTAPAQAKPKAGSDLVVMTQNLYLGSSLTPALEAGDDLVGFLRAVAQIYQTVQDTDFPARAEAIADEIAAQQPDLIGLQEVSRWTTAGPGAPPGYDFLGLLQDALVARGLSYTAASVSENASIGPAPLAVPECLQPDGTVTCLVQLDDRDVILVNEDTPGLTWSHPRSGRYADQQLFDAPGGGTISFDRGWASIEARLDGQKFHFVNTHLETEDFPEIQEAQAAQFLAGPARGGTIIAVGDFNSAADGSTTTSYAQLTAPGRFRDAWDGDELGPGYSCCQASALDNAESTLHSRIDLVLGRGAARSGGDEAMLVGDAPFQDEPPFWPSDHAGVVARFRL